MALGALVSPKAAPQATEKKKRKKAKKVGQIKAADAGLDGFVDWVDPISSEPAEEREGDMSCLVVGFYARMRKWAGSAQGETTPGFEGCRLERFQGRLCIARGWGSSRRASQI